LRHSDKIIRELKFKIEVYLRQDFIFFF
jgi:hypothetical protein